MEKLTAVFLDVLGSETGQESRAASIVKEGMQAEFAQRTKELMSGGTLYFSREGIRLKQELENLHNQTNTLTDAIQAVKIGANLSALYIRAEKLHRETQRQIHRPGKIDIGKIHFFYPDEQSEALNILEDYIKTELFRILTLLGGKAFLSLKPLKTYQHTLQDRVKYLKEQVSPMTDNRKMKDLAVPHYWAVMHKNERKAGPVGVLPGFEIIELTRTDHRFLPGEHREVACRQGIALQGVGCFTNVTPATIEKAQIKGMLHTRVTVEQLGRYVDYLKQPDAVLTHLFSDSLYAVDPAEYFGTASYVESSAAIVRRKRLGQCILCGKSSSGADFCEQCARRIKIV